MEPLEVTTDVDTSLETMPEIAGRVGSVLLYTADIAILDGEGWFNDQIINAYLSLIQKTVKGVVCLDSFFMSKERSNANLPEEARCADILFSPISTPGHWSLLVVWPKDKTLSLFDPAGMSNSSSTAQMRALYKRNFSIHLSVINRYHKGMTRQSNSFDCGLMVLMYAEALAQKKSLCFPKQRILKGRQYIKTKLISYIEK